MKLRPALDVSRLPDIDLGSGSLFWWGNVGLILIESTTFAIAIATYYYLRLIASVWPPPTVDPPNLALGTLGLALLLASCIPMKFADNEIQKRVEGKTEDLGRIRLGLAANCVLAVAAIVVRVYEFGGLHTKWNSNAYGSVTWTILGLHGGEAFASVLDTIVLTVLVFRPAPKEKQLLDVRCDSLFWYFMVAVWVPLYFTVYVTPRLTAGS
jgi:heme/copper-type cytochrome/quinol oxidase subunit 3